VTNDEDDEVFYSNLELHFYRCFMDHCTNCTFGTIDTEKCNVCDWGYDASDDNSECQKNYAAEIF